MVEGLAMKCGLIVLMFLQTSQFTNAILPITFYACETRYVTVRKQHNLREIGNRLLRNIPGTKREEVKETRKKKLE
jgi:hypothetical protein